MNRFCACSLRLFPCRLLLPAWMVLAVPVSGLTEPGYSPFASAPPLPAAEGQVVQVASADELLATIERVEPGTTILVADGDYRFPRVLILDGKRDLTIRGASGDPAKVTLRGKGWESGDRSDDILRIGRCDGVTIADLTFSDCRSYGIKVEAEKSPSEVHIYNCRFRDIGTRAIKGSAGPDPEVRARRGSVRFCVFENTRVPPEDWLFGGDYIAAIDMMALDEWTFSENIFRNIRGRNGGGRAAIFIWVRSRRVLVERNVMVNCDRGVAFGNPGQSTANRGGEPEVYVSDSVIRNNFIAGGPDCGIELWYAQGIKVFNNTIWRPERNWSRGIRIGKGVEETDVANNLVHGEIRTEGGRASIRQNLAGRLDGYFADPAAGDLTPVAAADGVVDRGAVLSEVQDDIRGWRRVGRPDIGAWEAGAEAADPPALEDAFELIREAVDTGPVPGAIALVARHGRVLRHEAFGVSDIENGIPFATNTLCWIASITKPVTVAAAMTLVESGQLRLEDTVEGYLPDFREQLDGEGRHHRITIRQLMSHTSGLTPNPPTRRSGWPIGGPLDDFWLQQNLPEIVGTIAKSTLRFEPGTRFEYSNSALFVLGRVIEVIAGKGYADYVRSVLFEPLGMTDTVYAPRPEESNRVAVIYGLRDGRRETVFRFNPAVTISNAAPDGGLFSYPGQFVPFVQMFVEPNGRVLSRESVRRMLTVQPHGWGLGWSLKDGLMIHEGSSGTVAWGDPETGVIGILFLQFRDRDDSDARLRARFRELVTKAFDGSEP